MRSPSFLTFLSLAVGSLLCQVQANEVIYADGSLKANWSTRGLGTTIDLSTSDAVANTVSVAVNSTQNGFISFFTPKPFGKTAKGLQFDISGNQPNLMVEALSDIDWAVSKRIPLSELVPVSSITSDKFSTVFLDFNKIYIPYQPTYPTAPDNWDTITFYAPGSEGAVYRLNNLQLVEGTCP
ncbi:hypothetical protein K474DRAFT_1710937 [Panus rudis PR-1116 ss-1]|nr:hypothetical protein K474DRAFT_1710937 [Panus rudis PR-1116 ss-1]